MHGNRLPNPCLSALICGSWGLEQQGEGLRHKGQEDMIISLPEDGRLRPRLDHRISEIIDNGEDYQFV